VLAKKLMASVTVCRYIHVFVMRCLRDIHWVWIYTIVVRRRTVVRIYRSIAARVAVQDRCKPDEKEENKDQDEPSDERVRPESVSKECQTCEVRSTICRVSETIRSR
jgi:hypothetical protein